jgi:hypothetical protein
MLPFAYAQSTRGFAAHPLNRLPAPSPSWGEEMCSNAVPFLLSQSKIYWAKSC